MKTTKPRYSSIRTAGLKFPKSNEDLMQEYETDRDALMGLKTVNLFIGANNSGKSRFLRALFFNHKFSYAISDFPYEQFKRDLDEFSEKLRAVYRRVRGGQFDAKEFARLRDPLPRWDNYFFEDGHVANRALKDVLRNIEFAKNLLVQNTQDYNSYVSAHAFLGSGAGRLIDGINRECIPKFIAMLEEYLVPAVKAHEAELHFYTPILRSLRLPNIVPQIRDAVMEDYFSTNGSFPDPRLRLFLGGELFDEMTRIVTDTSESRRRFAEFENFISENFFEGQAFEIIPKHGGKKVVHVRIGNSGDLPIYSLGDGIQSIIQIVFQGFFAETSNLIFVEEPELTMHPGMQRKLIDVIATNPHLAKHQWFFTTHSNHLIDMSLDFDSVSIFRFEKKAAKGFKIRSAVAGEHSLLSSIGALSSSVFRTNACIWVDGITDVQYLNSFLSAYLKAAGAKYRLDTHFSFVPYAGSNIANLNFRSHSDSEALLVQTIAGQSAVVLDGDNRAKGNRVEELEEAIKERCIVLPKKEIENIIHPALIRKAAANLLLGSRQSEKEKLAEKALVLGLTRFCGHIGSVLYGVHNAQQKETEKKFYR